MTDPGSTVKLRSETARTGPKDLLSPLTSSRTGPGGAVLAVGMGTPRRRRRVAFPIQAHAADELPGLRRGLGLAVVNWLLRIGFLVSPLLIGVLADATSLRVAFLTVVLAGLVTLILGRVLRPGLTPG